MTTLCTLSCSYWFVRLASWLVVVLCPVKLVVIFNQLLTRWRWCSAAAGPRGSGISNGRSSYVGEFRVQQNELKKDGRTHGNQPSTTTSCSFTIRTTSVKVVIIANASTGRALCVGVVRSVCLFRGLASSYNTNSTSDFAFLMRQIGLALLVLAR